MLERRLSERRRGVKRGGSAELAMDGGSQRFQEDVEVAGRYTTLPAGPRCEADNNRSGQWILFLEFEDVGVVVDADGAEFAEDVFTDQPVKVRYAEKVRYLVQIHD